MGFNGNGGKSEGGFGRVCRSKVKVKVKIGDDVDENDEGGGPPLGV